jgi:peptidoglycan hydrolase CwlO-like protein
MDAASVIKSIAEFGIIAGLFISLLLYVLKQNEIREKELRTALNEFSKCYRTLSVDSNHVAHAVQVMVNDTNESIDGLDKKLVCVDAKVDNVDRKVDRISDKLDTIHEKISK